MSVASIIQSTHSLNCSIPGGIITPIILIRLNSSFSLPPAVSCFMSDLSLKRMCTVQMQEKFPGYSRWWAETFPVCFSFCPLFFHILSINQGWFSQCLRLLPCLFPDPVRQWGRKQAWTGGCSGADAVWWSPLLHQPQRPRVHPHSLSLPLKLWGLRSTPVERL